MKSVVLLLVALVLVQSVEKKKLNNLSQFDHHGVNTGQQKRMSQVKSQMMSSRVSETEQGWVVENNAGGHVKVHI